MTPGSRASPAHRRVRAARPCAISPSPPDSWPLRSPGESSTSASAPRRAPSDIPLVRRRNASFPSPECGRRSRLYLRPGPHPEREARRSRRLLDVGPRADPPGRSPRPWHPTISRPLDPAQGPIHDRLRATRHRRAAGGRRPGQHPVGPQPLGRGLERAGAGGRARAEGHGPLRHRPSRRRREGGRQAAPLGRAGVQPGSSTVEPVADHRNRADLDVLSQSLSEEELAGIEAVAMHMGGPFIASTVPQVPCPWRSMQVRLRPLSCREPPAHR